LLPDFVEFDGSHNQINQALEFSLKKLRRKVRLAQQVFRQKLPGKGALPYFLNEGKISEKRLSGFSQHHLGLGRSVQFVSGGILVSVEEKDAG
jgi:hypothetical protein